MRPACEFAKKHFVGKKIKLAEIGVECGSHFAELIHCADIEKAYAIDIWDNYTQEGQDISFQKDYQTIVDRYKDDSRIQIIRKPSLEAVKDIEDMSLDMVYIDANHQYDFIRQDISAWIHKVKDGGILAGHDYGCTWSGVTQAVNQFVKDCNLELHVQCQDRLVQDWWFVKPLGINHLPLYMPPGNHPSKRMRILALTWPTFDDEERMMINARGDLVCPAIDGLTNEFLNLGHTVVYVNLFAEHRTLSEKDLACPAMLSGLPFYLWKDIKNKDFDIVWHACKDPTPEVALPYYERVMKELDPNIPVLNNVEKLKDHNKRKYISLLRQKNVGAIILEDELAPFLNAQGVLDYNGKCFPPSQACYVTKDYHAIRLPLTNSNRRNFLFSPEGGITLKYHNTAKYASAEPGFRTFFRVPYAAGKCLEGIKYFCPEDVLCPKSGAAVKREPFVIPDMSGGTIAACMKELGVDLAHIEGVEAGFAVEIFDCNPFPSSHGASLQPMSSRIAKRIEQVYSI